MSFGLARRQFGEPKLLCSPAHERARMGALAQLIAGFCILALALGTTAGIGHSQSPSGSAAAKACKAECKALKQAYRTAAEAAKVQRTEIEQLRRDLTDLDREWARLAKSSNRLTPAITSLRRRGDLLASQPQTAKTKKARASTRRELKQLKARFDKTRTKLAKIDKKRDVKKRQRNKLLGRFKTTSAREQAAKAKLDQHLNPGAPPQKVGVYASFEGSFDQCDTNDRTVRAHNIGVPVSELNSYLDRKDKSRSPKNKKLAKLVKKNVGTYAGNTDFPCPGLGNGHALSGQQVCKLWVGTYWPKNKNTTRPKLWDAGFTACEFEPGSGGSGVPPTSVCHLYAKTKLGLKIADTSIFVRWNKSSFDAVCFFFKKSDVASLIRDYRVSKEEKRLREIQKQIAKLKKYIASEMAFANKIEKDFKENNDGMGPDAAITNQVTTMSTVSKESAKWKHLKDKTTVAIGIWRVTREKIKNIPANNTTANTAVASLVVGEIAQKEFQLAVPWLASKAKNGTPVGIIATIIAMPVERAWKESVRKDYLELVDKRVGVWQSMQGRANAAIEKRNDKYWKAYVKWEKYKEVAKRKDRHDIDASNAGVLLKKLMAEKDKLISQIAQKEKSGN